MPPELLPSLMRISCSLYLGFISLCWATNPHIQHGQFLFYSSSDMPSYLCAYTPLPPDPEATSLAPVGTSSHSSCIPTLCSYPLGLPNPSVSLMGHHLVISPNGFWTEFFLHHRGIWNQLQIWIWIFGRVGKGRERPNIFYLSLGQCGSVGQNVVPYTKR